METWQQVLAAILLIGMLFFLWPGMKAGIERSKNSEEKHWGTFVLILLAIFAFVYLMILSLR